MTETLDTKGAAELLHVSEKLAAKMAREGELPAVWLAGQWLFVRHELLSWLTDKAREEQRFRREQALAMADIQKPARGPGRPRKIQVVG
jgi:excisionase family DNA binding protein